VDFVKMEGTGNDFVIVDGERAGLSGAPQAELEDLARRACDRHFGIGADGFILALPSARADLRMRMFNVDGSEAEACGNGMRCLARFARDRNLARGERLTVETLAGVVACHFVPGGRTSSAQAAGGQGVTVRVDMGVPRLRRSEIPMLGRDVDRVVDERIAAAGKDFFATCVSMGNPHCVVFVEDIGEVDLQTWGPALETHPVFPRRTNVEFVAVEDRGRLRMLVWERGSGSTLSCGSGASAAAVAAQLKGLSGPVTPLTVPGGELEVEWAADGHVWLSGPANEAFTGTWPRRGE
jgi:diaminopimelate epimerase